MHYQLVKWMRPRRCLTSFSVRTLSRTSICDTRIDKVLIANRGEIACRIARTARKLGIKTVAVYSDADKNAMHAESADEAYRIGEAPSERSYLRQERITAVAKASGCQAIHPGYGFLSENAEFAESCFREGITFVGPPASVIRKMGSKSMSKAIAAKAGVPAIEGYHGDDSSDETLAKEARELGFPLLIKAVRGGGGKGMRLVKSEQEFAEALASARTESLNAFGDAAMLLERYVENPRHAEVQIFADEHGNAVHLFGRDCSVQRRHQKILEEAPAPGLSRELETRMGEAAVRVAKTVGYVGAGTVEFILDTRTRSFRFLEMNTRLQVEHAVTEEITGLDLVEWQFKVAAGEKLPLEQEEIRARGHAFEARIYAEDPRNGFLPGAGPLLFLRAPRPEKNVRVETGVRQGDEVSVHYDPLIAKLVVRGEDRDEALQGLRSRLSEFEVAGVETNVEFLKAVCDHREFRAANVHTGFIEENRAALFPELQAPEDAPLLATLALLLSERVPIVGGSLDPFDTEVGFRVNRSLERTFEFALADEAFVVRAWYPRRTDDAYSMRLGETGKRRSVKGTLFERDGVRHLTSEIDGRTRTARVFRAGRDTYLFAEDKKWKMTTPEPEFERTLTRGSARREDGAVVSPMPGIVERVAVRSGDRVKTGDPLIVVVAMKMEHVVRAPRDGRVANVSCFVGDNVPKDRVLVVVNVDDEE